MVNFHRVLPLPFFISAIFLCAAYAPGAEPGNNPSAFPPETIVEEINPHDHTVESSFSSSLPIVVIEYADGVTLDTDVSALLTVYANPNGVNSLSQPPTVSKSVLIQENITDSLAQGKISCILTLAPSSDSETPDEPIAIGGLPVDRQWQLYGSVRDKGMLRNGVAYALGEVLMPEVTPSMQYCEVLTLLNGVYQYEGIHILSESPLRFFQKLSGNAKETVFLRQILRRERRGQHIVRGGNRIFSVIPTDSRNFLSAEERRRLGIELEKLDSILHSTVPASFLTYQRYLDEKSLMNLFILNSLTLNALDRRAPYFLMRAPKGKLTFLPDWDFDYAFDNSPERNRPLPFERKIKPPKPLSPLKRRFPVWRTLQEGGRFEDLRIYPTYKALGGENFPWLDRLLLSRTFLEGLQAHYRELHRSDLSPANLRRLVTNIKATLGHALERDWVRWRNEYAADAGPFALEPFVDKQTTRIRQTWSYDQDLVKITNSLNEQSAVILEQFDNVSWMLPDLYAGGTSGTRGAIYAFISLFVVLIFTHIITRRR